MSGLLFTWFLLKTFFDKENRRLQTRTRFCFFSWFSQLSGWNLSADHFFLHICKWTTSMVLNMQLFFFFTFAQTFALVQGEPLVLEDLLP